LRFSSSTTGIYIPGNKSYTIALNKGISLDKNLGILESFIALINTISSDYVGFALFKYPAITNTDFTAPNSLIKLL